jgi:hypothetical protein
MEANDEDLLAQIVRERDLRRARLENRRVGGNQTADDEELILPSLSSAAVPIKAATVVKEVSFTSSPGYSMRGSATLPSGEPHSSSKKSGAAVEVQRLEASAVHSPAPAVESNPVATQSQQRKGSVVALKGAVKVYFTLVHQLIPRLMVLIGISDDVHGLRRCTNIP